MTRIRNVVLGGIAALAIGGAASSALALEPGSFDNRLNGGSVGLPLGAAAPPGLYTGIETLVTPGFIGSGIRAGGSGLNFPSVGEGIPLLWSTGWNFLGASYSMSLVQAFYAAGTLPQGGASAPAGVSSWSPEIANTIWNPINLSWNLGGGWFVSAGFNFMGPDGSHWISAGNTDVNPDYWTFEPTLAIAYLANGWQLSANMFYDIQTASGGVCCALISGFTGGNEFYLDWAALYSIGKWQIGPVGYAKFQTTNDTISGNPAFPTGCTVAVCGKDAAAAFGGLVGYNFGPVDLQVWVTDAVWKQNDINGFAVWTRFGFRLWAPEAAKPLVAKN
jgi:hypothetical protein